MSAVTFYYSDGSSEIVEPENGCCYSTKSGVIKVSYGIDIDRINPTYVTIPQNPDRRFDPEAETEIDRGGDRLDTE